MRFYVKLFVAISVFAFAGFFGPRRMIGELRYEIRAAYVCRFGSPADFERLLDETHQAAARETGLVELYEFGKRFKQLQAERIAEATRGRGPLSEAEWFAIQDACRREAFEAMPSAARERLRVRPEPGPAAAAAAGPLHPFGPDPS
jgi:hypothetical protein